MGQFFYYFILLFGFLVLIAIIVLGAVQYIWALIDLVGQQRERHKKLFWVIASIFVSPTTFIWGIFFSKNKKLRAISVITVAVAVLAVLIITLSLYISKFYGS